MNLFQSKYFKFWAALFFMYSGIFWSFSFWSALQRQWETDYAVKEKLFLLVQAVRPTFNSPKSLEQILDSITTPTTIRSAYTVQEDRGDFYMTHASSDLKHTFPFMFRKPFLKVDLHDVQPKTLVMKDNIEEEPPIRTLCMGETSGRFLCLDYNLTSMKEDIFPVFLMSGLLYIFSLVFIFILALFFKFLLDKQRLFISVKESHSVLENVPVGISLFRKENPIYANHQFLSLCGLTADTLLSFHFSEKHFVNKDDYDKVKEALSGNYSQKACAQFDVCLNLQKPEWFRLFFAPISPVKVMLILKPVGILKQQEQALRDYELFSEILTYVRSLSDALGEDEYISEILEAVTRLFDFSFAVYGKVSGNSLLLNSATKTAQSSIKIKQIPMDSNDMRSSALIQTLLTHRPFGYNSLKKNAYYRKYLKKSAKLAAYAFPVILQGKEEGAVCFFSDKADSFQNHRVERLKQLLKELSVDVEKRRLRHQDLSSLQNYDQTLRAKVRELEKNKEMLESQSVEMNRLIENLTMAKEIAESANRMKTDFLASISHDLRTPLNAILGFSDLMRSETFGKMENEHYSEYIEYIHSSGEYLLSLINNILDLSRMESGKYHIEEKWFSLTDKINDILGTVRSYPQSRGKEISLISNCPPLQLLADENLLKQMMLNVLSNSVKFTQDGGKIDVGLDLSKTGDLVISVKDNGIGMPEDRQENLFQPFVSVENVFTKKYQGSGLGLSLVKKQIELHQGKTYLESEEGKGTIVYLVFPSKRLKKEETLS